ncbi:MAG: hypothetical protein C0597_00330 [Marinilabiliales bacterium]|nr:MAG: hypothetical protein C0597_00330 [Marinilabiliales bacterium]
MKKLLATLILFCFIANTYAQFTQHQQGKSSLMYKRAVLDVRFNKAGETVTYLMSEIEGSPYLLQNFVESQVLLNNGDTLKSVLLNYNIFTDAIEFMKEGVPYILTNSFILEKIKMDDKEFFYTKYLDLNDQFKHGYAEGLVNGDCKLFKKYQVMFNEPVPAETQFENPRPAKFSEMDPYYFLYFQNKDKTSRISTFNKKKFSELFGEKESEILTYIKEKKLKLTEEADIKNVIEYYNTL